MLQVINQNLDEYFQQNYAAKILLIIDKNVSLLYPNITQIRHSNTEIIFHVIEGGEFCKIIDQVTALWDILLDNEFSRDDLIINIGGGSISDLGGFVASTFKRGLAYINIPTTLLAMVDAAQGGKTGINYHHYKNLIGTIALPTDVWIIPSFLLTLSEEELKSGFAEIVKCALIGNSSLWNEIKNISSFDNIPERWIQTSTDYKKIIVEQDIYEKSKRKILNFGHTIGHAIETFFMNNQPISHGHAVAIGILVESFISWKSELLNTDEYHEIAQFITRLYTIPHFTQKEIAQIAQIAMQDKKNKNSTLQLTLLQSIGNAVINQPFSQKQFKQHLLDYAF